MEALASGTYGPAILELVLALGDKHGQSLYDTFFVLSDLALSPSVGAHYRTLRREESWREVHPGFLR